MAHGPRCIQIQSGRCGAATISTFKVPTATARHSGPAAPAPRWPHVHMTWASGCQWLSGAAPAMPLPPGPTRTAPSAHRVDRTDRADRRLSGELIKSFVGAAAAERPRQVLAAASWRHAVAGIDGVARPSREGPLGVVGPVGPSQFRKGGGGTEGAGRGTFESLIDTATLTASGGQMSQQASRPDAHPGRVRAGRASFFRRAGERVLSCADV